MALVTTSSQAAIFSFEAESGSVGSGFTTPADGGASGGSYITAAVSGGGDSPGSADRVASYSVDLDPSTVYDLYIRYYIGPGGGTDDSFFVGVGFGTQTFNDAADWYTVNQINASDGNGADLLDPEGGARVDEVYRWVNFSARTNPAENIGTFTSGVSGTEIFEVGAREDGLRLDAFAFVNSGEVVSSSDLNNSLVPEPGSFGLLAGLFAIGATFVRRRVS